MSSIKMFGLSLALLAAVPAHAFELRMPTIFDMPEYSAVNVAKAAAASVLTTAAWVAYKRGVVGATRDLICDTIARHPKTTALVVTALGAAACAKYLGYLPSWEKSTVTLEKSSPVTETHLVNTQKQGVVQVKASTSGDASIPAKKQ